MRTTTLMVNGVLKPVICFVQMMVIDACFFIGVNREGKVNFAFKGMCPVTCMWHMLSRAFFAET